MHQSLQRAVVPPHPEHQQVPPLVVHTNGPAMGARNDFNRIGMAECAVHKPFHVVVSGQAQPAPPEVGASHLATSTPATAPAGSDLVPSPRACRNSPAKLCNASLYDVGGKEDLPDLGVYGEGSRVSVLGRGWWHCWRGGSGGGTRNGRLGPGSQHRSMLARSASTCCLCSVVRASRVCLLGPIGPRESPKHRKVRRL